ncbi:MAG: glycerophosphodiester phosphodiesterase family protein [Flavobacteriales bacterium]
MKIIGHRGCRGVMPENSFEAFEYAVRLGVKSIELDVVVTGDGRLLISHEPYINPAICSVNGNLLPLHEKRNIFQMNAEEINLYDCGSMGNPEFPEQVKVAARKPYLKEALDIYLPQGVEILAEIKSEVQDYGVFQPFPMKYAELLMLELREYAVYENLILMSFDETLLNEIAAISSDFRLAYVTESPEFIGNQINKLHFNPIAVCPRLDLAKEIFAEKLFGNPFRVYPWTVNTHDDLNQLSGLEIQGIITDYPSRFMVFM